MDEKTKPNRPILKYNLFTPTPRYGALHVRFFLCGFRTGQSWQKKTYNFFPASIDKYLWGEKKYSLVTFPIVNRRGTLGHQCVNNKQTVTITQL